MIDRETAQGFAIWDKIEDAGIYLTISSRNYFLFLTLPICTRALLATTLDFAYQMTKGPLSAKVSSGILSALEFKEWRSIEHAVSHHIFTKYFYRFVAACQGFQKSVLINNWFGSTSKRPSQMTRSIEHRALRLIAESESNKTFSRELMVAFQSILKVRTKRSQVDYSESDL